MKTLRTTHGFTLPEMVITVGVLAILIGLSFPTLTQFLRQRDVANETAAQLQIKGALEAYLAQNGDLPADTGNWATALASFTNLSPNQILTDTWGNTRRYIMLQRNETMLGQTVPIYYATVISRGPNRVATAVANEIPTTGSDFAASTDTGWWKAQGNPTTSFANLEAAGDDMLTRFTDYGNKVDLYNTTLKRMQDVSGALESYAQTKFAEAVAAGVSNSETFIYYPPSYLDAYAGGDNGTVANWSEYAATVKSDVVSAQGTGSWALNIHPSNDTRRTAMVNLMRILGLPDEDCCTALETFNNSGVKQDVPFFYSSNPRPRTATGCSSRPNPLTGGTPLPPRLSTRTYADTSTCY